MYAGLVFFFNDTATTEIYTLSLHDALPISLPPGRGPDQSPLISRAVSHGSRHVSGSRVFSVPRSRHLAAAGTPHFQHLDRKSTRLNSSHANISYAVFCLKKKKRLSR